MPVGATTTINGREVIKITTTGKFVDLEWWRAKSNTTMQGWDDCTSLVTPTGANFTQGPTLIDVRDNKQYEIRKFADGKCWMVDNLMYGGDVDACAGKTNFAGIGSATPSNQFGANTYGDCRDPSVGIGSTYCATGAGVGKCGYLYNWQAAMQNALARYGVVYQTGTTAVQGLCPEGWRLPIGWNSGDFVALHSAVGSTNTGFWQNPSSWLGLLGGNSDLDGTLGDQGVNSRWWSSTQSSDTNVYNLVITGTSVNPSTTANIGDGKRGGFFIRCLKN